MCLIQLLVTQHVFKTVADETQHVFNTVAGETQHVFNTYPSLRCIFCDAKA